jgi:hypothetical protein
MSNIVEHNDPFINTEHQQVFHPTIHPIIPGTKSTTSILLFIPTQPIRLTQPFQPIQTIQPKQPIRLLRPIQPKQQIQQSSKNSANVTRPLLVSLSNQLLQQPLHSADTQTTRKPKLIHVKLLSAHSKSSLLKKSDIIAREINLNHIIQRLWSKKLN